MRRSVTKTLTADSFLIVFYFNDFSIWIMTGLAGGRIRFKGYSIAWKNHFCYATNLFNLFGNMHM